MRYTVAIEQAGSNYSVHGPDLPGCVATGATFEEAGRNIGEAIRLQSLRRSSLRRSMLQGLSYRST